MTQAAALITTFEHDVNVSASEKSNILKMLQTILHNLATEDDEKFRSLRLGNAKIHNLTRYPTIMMLLTQVAGFSRMTVENEDMLKVTTVPEGLDSVVALIAGAFQRVSVLVPKAATTNTSQAPLTEKQKARLLAEQKLEREKQEAREARKRTAAQIQADKYVRENDPNWKPQVNAAAAKSGTSISTFRDKYGES
ncbi:hypothetical protein FisN_16Hh250 [Fistulifera solaris]|uniref:Uncharacterized protein n=1 Tax=Fistulifera solaris TaxID=1519565 RepID=A0A1Z5KSN3_FISSO|nr:hypothetical protein FisN_16Hh250 [Fistulifera solaris]|eukprot:GAX29316.1 hypothetical protein FisN_16Hh250 [Fistulifera solaris]